MSMGHEDFEAPGASLRCWKFVIPVGERRQHPTEPGAFASCAAIVFAETQARAAALLRAACPGRPWADVATVTEVDVFSPSVALSVEIDP